MLIGQVAARGRSTFTLRVAGAEIPVAHIRPPMPGDRVAVEGSLRSRSGSLYVEARALDVVRRHMPTI